MAVLVAGVAFATVLFVLPVGFVAWSSRRRRWTAKYDVHGQEPVVGHRGTGLAVAILSLTANWVDGTLMTAGVEAIGNSGLLGCQVTFGCAFSLIVIAAFFARPMWRAGHVTMLDPLQETFPSKTTTLLFLPMLAGNVLFNAAILSAVGVSVSTLTGFTTLQAMIIASLAAALCAGMDGPESTNVVDAFQLLCVSAGVWLCVPFAVTSEHVRPLSELQFGELMGTVPLWKLASYIDELLMITLGCVPWQASYQRILSTNTDRSAQLSSLGGGVGILVMNVPAITLGIVARSVNWNETSYPKDHGSESPLGDPLQGSFLLSLTLQYLTPAAVAFIGQAAVAAASMPSMLSGYFCVAEMLAKNVYQPVFRPKASRRELLWVLRFSVAATAAMSLLIAASTSSVYELAVLSADYVYVTLFPLLLAAVRFPHCCNEYGSLSCICVGMTLRLLAGEPVLGIPAVSKYPFYDEVAQEQRFPLKTLTMLVTLTVLVTVSKIAKVAFERRWLKPKYDFFECCVKDQNTEPGGVPSKAFCFSDKKTVATVS